MMLSTVIPINCKPNRTSQQLSGDPSHASATSANSSRNKTLEDSLVWHGADRGQYEYFRLAGTVNDQGNRFFTHSMPHEL